MNQYDMQKEIDYWHEMASSYEQTIVKLSKALADVRENVHGEWLPKWSEFFKRTLPYCSRCLQGFFFETDFCPHCGADMRKGEKQC